MRVCDETVEYYWWMLFIRSSFQSNIKYGPKLYLVSIRMSGSISGRVGAFANNNRNKERERMYIVAFRAFFYFSKILRSVSKCVVYNITVNLINMMDGWMRTGRSGICANAHSIIRSLENTEKKFNHLKLTRFDFCTRIVGVSSEKFFSFSLSLLLASQLLVTKQRAFGEKKNRNMHRRQTSNNF